MMAERGFLAFRSLIRVMVADRGFKRVLAHVAARELAFQRGSLNLYSEKG